MQDWRNLLSREAGAKDAVKSADFGFRLIVYHLKQLIISASSKWKTPDSVLFSFYFKLRLLFSS